jgi:hypothetical protein
MSDIHFQAAYLRGALLAGVDAALSRKVARDRTWSGQPRRGRARAWVLGEAAGPACTIFVNESGWLTTVREFSPVPLGSRIPTLTLPTNAVEVMDESIATTLGLDEALARLAT